MVGVGYGIGNCLGLFLPAGIYRLHLNPVLTVAHVVYKGYPARRIPLVFLSQIIGSALGVLLTAAIFSRSAAQLVLDLQICRFLS
ncbi:Glycerol uptake/efflux facilitator protein, partial [Smittium mucronatum]